MTSLLAPAIPAGQLVSVVPSVLGAGGAALQFNGIILDDTLTSDGYPLLPSGQVYSFANAPAVASYYGATSQQAGLGDVYYQGPLGATQLPSTLLFAQYALANTPAFLLGGQVTSLTTVQGIVAQNLTVTIDGVQISQSLTLSTATSLSNAAVLMGSQLGITGIQIGQVTASLSATSPHLDETALIQGAEQAVVTASLSGTTMTVTNVTSGYLAVGQAVEGTGITAGTTILSYNGAGKAGGIGSYTLSQSATTETAETVTAYAAAPILAIGTLVTGTGIIAGTYISAYGTGTGGIGTYVLSQAPTTEPSETVTLNAPAVVYNANTKGFVIRSGTAGAASTISYASGGAAATLGLTLATGAIVSPGAAASAPSAFMDSITAITQNWVSFMTTWEPTDADKQAFATWNNAQNDSYVYEAWETDILDTETTGSALANFLTSSQSSGTDPIWTNPAITTLMGEKAAFQMSWTACINFSQKNGVQTAAYRSYTGGLPDVVSSTVALNLAGTGSSYGNGVNFYGQYTTRNQAFNYWQRGLISGPFMWKDAYVNQIWLNNSLQLAIMVGLGQVGSVPYTNIGSGLIDSWCADPIQAGLNFGAITPGATLTQAQITEVNTQAGTNIAQTLQNRGWYLQVQAANTAGTVRASRSSPPCTFWYVYQGSVQQINLASIEVA